MQLSFFDFFFSRRRVSARPERRRPYKKKASDPELHAQWVRIREEYFPDRPDVDDYRVYWSSRRQKRTLAACYTERKHVIVARELNHSTVSEWLDPLLYHEMCHAVLGENVPMTKTGRRQWHGRTFKELEARHPRLAAFEHWVKSGGWERAIRSDRARRAHAARKASATA